MLKTLQDLFVHELKDVASAEDQLTKALPKMIKAAQHPDLKEGFATHLEETRGHLERVQQLLASMGTKGKVKCAAMAGIIKEGNEMIKERAAKSTHDAALIAAAQKVEHYEIASYGTLRTWAEMLGNTEAVEVLEEILNEEKATDEKLTELAGSINQESAVGE